MAGDTSGGQNRGERLIVIANPRGGGGRAGAAQASIERAAHRAFAQVEVRWTRGPGHAGELARVAAGEADIVAALGGDGTCSEVINGLVPGGVPLNPRVVFSVIPFGTGCDLARSLEIPKALDRAFWLASTGMTLPLDLGMLSWPDGRTRMFVNAAGAGANADVCTRANASSKRWGGRVTFLRAVFGALRSFAARPVRWRWEGPDGSGSIQQDTFAAFCANGQYCGAGMWVGKGGSMADGVFELTILPPYPLGVAVRLVPQLYDGRLGQQAGASRVRVTEVWIDGTIPLEADGEAQPSGPATIRMIPRALQVRGGWLHPPQSGR